MSVLLAAACAGVLLTPSTGAAAPEPTGGSGDRAAATGDPGAAFWAKHERVGEVADALVAEAGRLPRQGGYAGLITKPEKSRLTLYWKGTVPERIRRVMRSDRRVTVKAVQAPYTRHQLDAARDRLFAQRAELPGKLTTAGPSPDGKGLLIGMAPSRSGSSAAREAGDAAVAREATGLADGVAVVKVETASPKATTGGPISALAAGRNAQQAYGGARWLYHKNGGRYVCSTAFAVRYPGTSVNRMTSAAHCGTDNGAAHSPEYPTSRPFGRMYWLRYDRDISIMNAEQSGANGFFRPAVWWGPWVGDQSGQYTRSVKGLSNNHVGQRVCSSGASSGTICNNQITATGHTVSYAGQPNIRNIVVVRNYDGNSVWGPGDSGGPIVQPVSGGGVHANGVVSGSDKSYSAPCQGETNRQCSSLGYYGALDSFLSETGLQLITQ